MKNKKLLANSSRVFTVILAASMALGQVGCAKVKIPFLNKEEESADEETAPGASALTAAEILQGKMNDIVQTKSSTDGKDETVYVVSDANGNARSIIVSEHLMNGSGKNEIEDKTDLSQIENVNGYEEYKEGADGKITWAAGGNDIYYRGTTDKQLPVDVKVSYKLDGQDISPEDLAGKSGKVTIRFDYTNNETTRVMIRGEEEEVKVPFAMMSGVVLPAENFSNINVTNGKVISEGKNNIVMGLAFPGLKESVNIDKLKEDVDDEDAKKKIDDVKVPDYVEITADATDFKLDMTMTTALSNLLSDINLTGDVNTDKVRDKMDELQDGSDQLVDGSGKLKDGTADLKDGTGKLRDGAGDLKDGTSKLADGTDELKDGTASAVDGADQLKDGTEELYKGTGDLKDGTVKLKDGSSQLAAGAGDLKNGTSQLANGTDQLADGTGQVAQGTAQLKAGTKELREKTAALPDGAAQLDDGASQLDSGAGELASGLGDADNGAKQIAGGLNQMKASLSDQNPDMQKLKGAPALLVQGLSEVRNGLVSANEGVRQMEEGVAGMPEKVAAGISEQFGAILEQMITAQVKQQLTSPENAASMKALGLEPASLKDASLDQIYSVLQGKKEDVDKTLKEGIGKVASESAASGVKAGAQIGAAAGVAGTYQAMSQAGGQTPGNATPPADPAKPAAPVSGDNESDKGSAASGKDFSEYAEAHTEGEDQDNKDEETQQAAPVQPVTGDADAGDKVVEDTDTIVHENTEGPDGGVAYDFARSYSFIQNVDNDQTQDPAAAALAAKAGEIMTSVPKQVQAVQPKAAETAMNGLLEGDKSVPNQAKDAALNNTELQAGLAKYQAYYQLLGKLDGLNSVTKMAKAEETRTKVHDTIYKQLSEDQGMQALLAGLKQLDWATNPSLGEAKEGEKKNLVQGVDALIAGVKQLGEGTATALTKMSDGVDQLAAGASKLSDGTGKLRAGADQLKDGTGKLKVGTSQLRGQSGQLVDGIGQLDDGASQLQNGVSQLAEGTVKVRDGAHQLDEGAGKLQSGASQLDNGIGQVNDGAGKLQDGARKLNDGVGELQEGARKLDDGARQLKDGAHELDKGADDLIEGVIKLDDGAGDLNQGAADLEDGMIKMNDEGIKKLTEIFGDNIDDAIDRINAVVDAGTDYTSFAGTNDSKNSTVKFIYKTDAIKAHN